MAFLPKGFELVIILVAVALIFGPKNLPKLGKALGETMRNLRSGMEGNSAEADAENEAALLQSEQAANAE